MALSKWYPAAKLNRLAVGSVAPQACCGSHSVPLAALPLPLILRYVATPPTHRYYP